MEPNEATGLEERSVGRLKMLIWLAVAGVAAATAAGLILLATQPETGSATEAALGLMLLGGPV